MQLPQTSLSPAQLLMEVEDLLRSMPPVTSFEEPGMEHYAWLGRASALVHCWDSVKAIARFDGYVGQLGSGSLIDVHNGAQGVLTMLYQLRHDVILRNPSPQSTNIASGMVFEYFDEVRKAAALAKSDLFFVDPYLDADFVSRYLPVISAGTTIRLLSRERMASLVPAATLYQRQSGATVMVRSALGFHDRYFFVDRALCYQSGSSFKDGAKNAPTTLTEIKDAFQAVLDTYEAVWSGATVHI